MYLGITSPCTIGPNGSRVCSPNRTISPIYRTTLQKPVLSTTPVSGAVPTNPTQSIFRYGYRTGATMTPGQATPAPGYGSPQYPQNFQSFWAMQQNYVQQQQQLAQQQADAQTAYQASAAADVASGAAAPAPTSTGFDFSSIPTWGWVAAGIAVLFVLKGNRGF